MVLTKVPGTLIADSSITSTDILDSTITNAKMAVDPSNASNLSSGDVPLAQLGNVPDPDLTAQKGDIALLAFKTQANGNLAKYNLVDQTVDAFEDATGIDASASTNGLRDGAGNFFYGAQSQTGSATVTSFNTSTTWTSPSGGVVGGTMKVLVVAGGGGGGRGYGGGGGGGGGVVYHSSFAMLGAVLNTVTIGAGGVGGTSVTNPNTDATNGEDSVFGSGLAGSATHITANGGGCGGGYEAALAGGSVGGRGYQDSTVNTETQSTSTLMAGGLGFGSNGGSSISGAGSGYCAGGGGGANAAGTNAGTNSAGDGGNGYDATAVFGTVGGASGIFAGGGGAGCHPQCGGGAQCGGTGGTGGGGDYSGSGNGTAGTANTGGGGSGIQTPTSTTAGAGGSGFVALAYTPITFVGGLNMTLVSNATTAQAAPTKGDLVFTYTNETGTNTVGTDITVEYSADDGSTWTDFGIVPADIQGTTGGHTIVTKNNVTLTSTSGTTMRWRVKTLNQGVGTKVARIYAVSLGWS